MRRRLWTILSFDDRLELGLASLEHADGHGTGEPSFCLTILQPLYVVTEEAPKELTAAPAPTQAPGRPAQLPAPLCYNCGKSRPASGSCCLHQLLVASTGCS